MNGWLNGYEQGKSWWLTGKEERSKHDPKVNARFSPTIKEKFIFIYIIIVKVMLHYTGRLAAKDDEIFKFILYVFQVKYRFQVRTPLYLYPL